MERGQNININRSLEEVNSNHPDNIEGLKISVEEVIANVTRTRIKS